MSKKWTEDEALMKSLSVNLLDALAVFPKQMLRLDALVREFDMPISHIQILTVLREGEVSIGALSERMGIAKPNITPLVDALCERDLAMRIRCMQDRRVVKVRIADDGTEMLEKIQASIARQVESWSVAMNRSEAKELNAALQTLLRLGKVEKTKLSVSSTQMVQEEKLNEENEPEAESDGEQTEA